jgi:hypothetical protein
MGGSSDAELQRQIDRLKKEVSDYKAKLAEVREGGGREAEG